MRFSLSLFVLLFLISCTSHPTKKSEGFDAELTGYQYPYKVEFFSLELQRQNLKMAYMDLVAKDSDAPVIVLLHGKNFGGFAFRDVAKKLNEMGYRVIMPDQIGFGKSSKPQNFQFTFQTLAESTNQLLKSLGITKYTVLGHSMGGMLATRMSLMYPENVKKLILVNPIGLEDWKLLTPYKSIDQMYQLELKNTPESIKNYQSNAYYSGKWKSDYDWLIEAASGQTQHADFPKVAWDSALTYDMLFTQPVIYEFPKIKVPTRLIIGQLDKTAPGKAWAPEENKKKMGLYPQLGKNAHKLIPNSKIYELKNLGHVPFVEDLNRFFKEGLIPALNN